MANEAEVTLNIKAEYKQALSSIALLAKALEALQKQATIMLNMGTGTPGAKDAPSLNMNPAEVAKFRDVMTETSKAVAGVSAELIKLGDTLLKQGIPPERVKEVAELAERYNALATSVADATTQLHSLTGTAEGTAPQISVMNERVKLLQEQVEALQKQLVEVKNTKEQGEEDDAPGNAKNGTMAGNVRTMTWLQQAQAARRLARSIGELSDSFSTLAEDAQNGNLNLTAMVGNMAMLGYAMKGALGPISAIILAVEMLQGAWNAYARSTKRALEAEADIQATLNISKKAYDAAKDAKQAYLKQEERKNELVMLKEEYAALNTEIERGLDLIKETIAAEIARLALTEDEAEHAETMRKAELGRKLMAGEISQAEYQQEIIAMNRQSKIRKAEAAVTRAEATKRGTADSLTASRAAFTEKQRKANELEQAYIQFLPEEELEAMKRGRDELRARREERYKRFREAEKEENNELWGGWFGLEAAERKSMLNSMKAELHTADRALLDYETWLNERLGGESIESYETRKEQAKARLDIVKGERDKAGQSVEAAWNADNDAARKLQETRTRSLQEIRQAGEYADSELETMKAKEEEMKRQAERDKEYRKLQKQIADMTNDEIRRAQASIQKALQDNQMNEKYRAHFERIDTLYSDTLLTRSEQGKQAARDIRELAAEGPRNRVTQWATQNAEEYTSGPLNRQQTEELLKRGNEAILTRGTQDDKVMSLMIDQAKFNESVTYQQREKIKKLERELEKSKRKTEAIIRNMF